MSLVDLHTHILPGLDDGATDNAMSLRMAERAAADGVTVMAATPHAFDGCGRSARRLAVQRRVASLQAMLDAAGIGLRLQAGAEILLCRGVARRVLAGEAATLDPQGRYLLVELPPLAQPEGIFDELFQLTLAGITPVLAHPERHPLLQRDPWRVAALCRMGCLVQLTAMSVTGEFGEPAMSCAHTLLRDGMAHLIASDAHDDRHRPPLLKASVAAAADVLGSPAQAYAMVSELPRRILAGEPVDVPAPAVQGAARTVYQKWQRWFGHVVQA